MMDSQNPPKKPRGYTKNKNRKDQDGNPIPMAAGAMGTSSRGSSGSTRGKKRRMAGADQGTVIATNPFDDEPSSGPLNHLHHQVHYQHHLSQPHHHQPQTMLLGNHHQHPHGPPHPHPLPHPHAHSHPHPVQPHHDFHNPPPPMHMSSPGPPGYVSMPPGSPAMIPGGVAPVYSPAPASLPHRMGAAPPGSHIQGPTMMQHPHQQLGTPPHMVCTDQISLQPPPPQPPHHQSPGMGTPSPRPPPLYQPQGGLFQAGYGPDGGPVMIKASPTPPQVAGPSPGLQQQHQHIGPASMQQQPPMGMPDQMSYQQQQPQQQPQQLQRQQQMLVYCAECRQPIYQNEPKMMCRAGCDSYYHRSCSGLSELACELLLRESSAEWVCNRCVCSDRKIPVVRLLSQQPDCRQSVL